MRNGRTGPSRSVRLFLGAALLSGVAALPAHAADLAQAPVESIRSQGQGIDHFYAARGNRPLWIGQPGRQVEVLFELLDSAGVDGLDRRRYNVRDLQRAVRNAQSGNMRDVMRADRMLSEALVRYARDLRRPAANGVIYVDPELKPGPQSPRAILEAAAAMPSLERYVAKMGWMHPLYGQLRLSMMTRQYRSRDERDRLAVNLERARELPGGTGRHVLVNAAAQRLYMYENGEVVDSMRVVVGKPHHQTPAMAALIRYASLNPYWNVPADLAAERIAPNVVKGGMAYLKSRGYQVLSDWTDNAKLVDPKTIDWNAVVAGQKEIRMRQLPGPGNSMGRMKFMFPNAQGIYLHDTPEKELLEEASRMFSGGCVRLEDASRLGRWLFGKTLKASGSKPEQKVSLDKAVPVYLTYLTAVPSGFQLAFFDDIYGRDQALMSNKGHTARMAAADW